MAKFVKLTSSEGAFVQINVDNIIYIWYLKEGAQIMLSSGKHVNVIESPNDIAKEIEDAYSDPSIFYRM